MGRAQYYVWNAAYLSQKPLYLEKLSENIHVFDRKHFVWGHLSNTVYHLKQQKCQDKNMCCWILGYLKTNLSRCIYVHIIPKCSALDYFYKCIPLKQSYLIMDYAFSHNFFSKAALVIQKRWQFSLYLLKTNLYC